MGRPVHAVAAVVLAGAPLVRQTIDVRAKVLATVAGVVPGALIFIASRELAFATVCDCWSTRMAGTFACLCLGTVVGLAIAVRVLDRLAPPPA